MRRLPFYLFILFLVFLYTKGLWGRAGVPEPALDGVLLALPILMLLNKRGALGRPAPGFLFVWLYLGWSLFACIYNDEGVVRGLLYARFLLVAYFILWATWSSRFTTRQIFQIHAVILALFVLQVAAASFEWLVLGQQVEANVGTLGYETGAIATNFPVFAFSCMLAFFLYTNTLAFLVVGFSFVVVGYASGKLAIYYFMPIMLVLGLILYAVAEGLRSAFRRGSIVVVLVVCVLPFLLFLLSHTHRMEALQAETGVRDKLGSFFNYTQRGVLESQSWYTTTRFATSARVVQETFKRGPSVFLFGQGTHVFLEMSGQVGEGAYEEYGIVYGIVGWSADALAVGWPAMFAHVGFYLYLFRLFYRRTRQGNWDTYWKAVMLAVQLGFLVFLITYFLYSPYFTVGSWLSSVYFHLLGVVLAPQYRETLYVHPMKWPVFFCQERPGEPCLS